MIEDFPWMIAFLLLAGLLILAALYLSGEDDK